MGREKKCEGDRNGAELSGLSHIDECRYEVVASARISYRSHAGLYRFAAL